MSWGEEDSHEAISAWILQDEKQNSLPCSRDSISHLVGPDNSERHGRIEQRLRLNHTILDQ